MIEPDWIFGALGGLMIGAAAALYLLANGRIMGASGILGGLVDGSARADWRERGAFILGLVAAPAALFGLTGGQAATHLTPNLLIVAAAGLLVGAGTRIANGCTSGHGVCGISRLSVRGIVATVVYLIAGGATVLVFRHMLGVI
ncbi:MAG: YeeE/YedE thiosulfate transporter family protein [Rhodobacteraceae bacterium]|nr:YeeE/YedE thiosulfate transporter family protein [Paracoccaceae bacterium]